MRLTDADEMLKRAETWNTEDWMDKALYNFMRARIIEQPTVDIDAITESHEKIGYDKGFRDGYAQATSEVRHGHWIESDVGLTCSECNHYTETTYYEPFNNEFGRGWALKRPYYCGYCGCKMDEVEDGN